MCVRSLTGVGSHRSYAEQPAFPSPRYWNEPVCWALPETWCFGALTAARLTHARAVHLERSLSIAELGTSGALLAYAMNGEQLPVHHGYPLRLVVPSWYAVAPLKWLTHIEVIDRPFDGHFQIDRYHIDGEPLSLLQVRALIIEPRPGRPVEPGPVVIRGVAWSGAAPIEQVELSIDGASWQPATLIGERRGRPRYGDAARAGEHLPIGLRHDLSRLWIRLGSGLAQKVMAEILYRRIASRTRVAVGADIESGNLPGDDPGAGPVRCAGHSQRRGDNRRLLLRVEELELSNPAWHLLGAARPRRNMTIPRTTNPS
jgi:Oxidoreductase molybdopterin binding domain/Mo-co oxidoreductase dimerisation domain